MRCNTFSARKPRDSALSALSIILVNYNGSRDTIECVRSIEESNFGEFEIIIVDNGSQAGTVEQLRAACPHCTVIGVEENIGFAAGNNIGLKEALERGGSRFLLLNNDTTIDASALSRLMKALESSDRVGIVGAKIRYFSSRNKIWYAGGILSLGSGSFHHRGIGEEDLGQYDLGGETQYVTGCCLLFRRQVVDKIGFLDESYFAYLEDADFCVRARKAGFSILYEPHALVYHKVSSTSARDSPVYLYLNLRNKILFLHKHSRLDQWLPCLPAIAYYYVRQFIRLIFKWRDPKKVKSAWYGLVDGLAQRTGDHGEGRLQAISVSKGHAF